MKVDDLVSELATMFPQAFSERSLTAWSRVYREALERYEGRRAPCRVRRDPQRLEIPQRA
jgi:hypothetical protein